MDIYKINYSQIRQNPSLAKMLEALERGFAKYEIDFYLVGAVARDVWISVNELEARRTTANIDFAILINNKSTFSELKNYLIENEGFSPYSENGFVLIWKDKTQVDLLPFGAVTNLQRNWPNLAAQVVHYKSESPVHFNANILLKLNPLYFFILSSFLTLFLSFLISLFC